MLFFVRDWRKTTTSESKVINRMEQIAIFTKSADEADFQEWKDEVLEGVAREVAADPVLWKALGLEPPPDEEDEEDEELQH